jgi:hypothetical protein
MQVHSPSPINGLFFLIMKRCLNIKTTDLVLWIHIVDILSDTIKLKEKMSEFGFFGLGKTYDQFVSEKALIKGKTEKLKEELKRIERGLVDLETKRMLNEFDSDVIYKGIRRNLRGKYHQVESEISNLNNHLEQIGNDKLWFDWFDKFGNEIRSKRDIPESQKKRNIKVDHSFHHR